MQKKLIKRILEIQKKIESLNLSKDIDNLFREEAIKISSIKTR